MCHFVSICQGDECKTAEVAFAQLKVFFTTATAPKPSPAVFEVDALDIRVSIGACQTKSCTSVPSSVKVCHLGSFPWLFQLCPLSHQNPRTWSPSPAVASLKLSSWNHAPYTSCVLVTGNGPRHYSFLSASCETPSPTSHSAKYMVPHRGGHCDWPSSVHIVIIVNINAIRLRLLMGEGS